LLYNRGFSTFQALLNEMLDFKGWHSWLASNYNQVWHGYCKYMPGLPRWQRGCMGRWSGDDSVVCLMFHCNYK
jgi:hypothetical protein